MSIKIAVSEEQKYKVPPALVDNSKNVSLLYVKPSSRQLLNEVSKYQKNGKVVMTEADGIKAMLSLLDDCIVGWEGVQDEKGKKLDFQKEYIEFLPFEIQMDFVKSVITPQWSNISTGINKKTEQVEKDELGN